MDPLRFVSHAAWLLLAFRYSNQILRILTVLIYLSFELFSYSLSLYVVSLALPPQFYDLIPNMETKAAELLATLKNVNFSIDAKASQLTLVKSDIKQKNVPDGAILPIFESLRLALTSQHSSLLSAGFSTLGHFLKRLFIQEQDSFIALQGRMLYPILLERLGDRRERTRAQAAQAFTDLWPAVSSDVEHYVLEIALVGKNARAKEMSMIWLANMTKTHGLLFRAYVPSLVACLEDADSAVRDTAKMTVVDLFQNAPARAKSDLTKQLSAHNVRKSISNAILTSIGLSSAEPEHSSISRPASRAEALHQRPASVMSSRSHHMIEASNEEVELPKPQRPVSRVEQRPVSRVEQNRTPGPSHAATAAPDELPEDGYVPRNDPENVEPLIIASSRDIDDMVRDMLPCFDGRESEENWVARERNVITLRRLIRGNAPQSFPTQFIGAMKNLLDGVFKVVNSLRTTLCTAGCLVIQDLAKTCGPRIDSMVEIMMQNLIKLCGGMKKISAQNGNVTVDAVIGHVTFTARILQHITSAAQDRNAQLRLHAAGWIKTIITRQARHKSTMEHAGGLDNLDKSIRKGLSDANPAVRETMRGTFWVFFNVWPGKANDIMSALDSKSRALLEKDPANPNVDQSSSKTPSASQKGLSSSTSAMGSRSALKEAIAAQKRARLSPKKPLPARPESAQSAFSDVKATSEPTSKPSSTAVRTVPTGSHISSLSSAPMRPAMKPRRPELARPATADPYARRTGTDDSRSKTPKQDGSPRTVKTKPSATPSSKLGSTRPQQKIDSAQTGTTMTKPKKLDISKSRLHDQYATASRSRSGSDDSMAQQASGRLRVAPDGRDSPASIQLESPPGSAIQRPIHAAEGPVSNDPIKIPSPQLHPVERSTPEPSRETAVELGDTLPSPDPVLNHARKQPAPVHIYEDPDVPTEPENQSGTAVHDSYYISADTLARDEQQQADAQDTSPIARHGAIAIETESEAASYGHDQFEAKANSVDSTPRIELEPTHNNAPVATDAPAIVAEPESVLRGSVHSRANDVDSTAEMHSTDVENQSEFPISHEVEEPASPTPSVVRHPVTDADASFTRSPSSSPRGGNNENSTPHVSKSVNVSNDNRSPSKHVLEEIPNNEPANRDNKQLWRAVGKRRSADSLSGGISQDRTPRRKKFDSERWRSISPRSRDPVKAREMLEKGIQRIRTKTMDILGYRKLQGLIRCHDSIFDSESEFDEMLTALLQELESPPDEKRGPLGRPLDLKTQVLVTIRIMFMHNKNYFAAYCPQAMTALISARKRYPSSCHIVSGLEETAEDIMAVCEAEPVIVTILGLLETETKDEEGSRAVTMGTSIVSRLVRGMNATKTALDDGLVERIGGFCGRHLTAGQPDVRRQVTELCVALHWAVTDETRFWQVLGSPQENSRNLLTYYIHKSA